MDLKDETSTRFFGVIGKIDSEVPEMAVRAASGGNSIPLEIEDIFDYDVVGLHLDSDYSLDDAILANITEHKYTYNKAVVGGKQPLAVYGDDDYDDYFNYPAYNNNWKSTNTYSSRGKTKKYSDSLTYTNNPYSQIYNNISQMRYANGVFDDNKPLDLVMRAIDCAKVYYKDFDKTAQQFDDLLNEIGCATFAFDIKDYDDQSTTTLLPVGL